MQEYTITKSKAEQKNYYSEINIARGIAVLFVLLGHSTPDTQTGIANPIAQFIHMYCYSFHMALFFMLSGFVSARKLFDKRVKVGIELIKKVKRLIVPYLFYSFITMGLKQVFSIFAINKFDISELWKILLGSNPNGGMWFLWSLFMIWLISFVIGRFTANEYVFATIGLVVFVVNQVVSIGYASKISQYFIFYAIGIVLNRNYSKIKCYLNVSVWVGIAFFIILTGLNFLNLKELSFTDFYLITALVGSYAVWNIAINICKYNGRIKDFFDECGAYSYDIYLLSYFVQVPIRILFNGIVPLPYWIVVAMMFVFGLIISYLTSKYVVRRTKYIKRVLVGDWK